LLHLKNPLFETEKTIVTHHKLFDDFQGKWTHYTPTQKYRFRKKLVSVNSQKEVEFVNTAKSFLG